MSIIRKRSAAQKAYIPINSRDNHYLLAEFALTDELINTLVEQHRWQQHNYAELYHFLSENLYTLSDKAGIKNAIFIANDKLARVRYSQEMHQWQTNQQILLHYNPSYHELQKGFYDANYKAEKVTLLFLATGDEIRSNAALFHSKVAKLLAVFEQEVAKCSLSFRLRDHQHLTYDLFAKAKGCNDSKAHKFRKIDTRYASQQVSVPQQNSQLTFAMVNLPVSHSLIKLADIDLTSEDPYNPLYTLVTDAFTQASKRYNLNNGAMIANGLIPIVRSSNHEAVSSQGELQMLGYNPSGKPCGMISKWDAQTLVDNIQFIFVAYKDSYHEAGFARFVNQIEQAIKLIVTELEISPAHEEVIVRFHQHLAYDC